MRLLAGGFTLAFLTTIAAGPIVFAEPLPANDLGLAVRLLAFGCVIVAAALTPPPAADRAKAPPTATAGDGSAIPGAST